MADKRTTRIGNDNNELFNLEVKNLEDLIKLQETKEKELIRRLSQEQRKQLIEYKSYYQEQLGKANSKIDEQNKELSKKTIKDLVEYEAELEKFNIKLSDTEKKKFIEQRAQQELNEQKKILLKYYEESSKQSEKQKKKEEKELNKKIENAKRLSKFTDTGEQKSQGQILKDKTKLDISQNLDTFKKSFQESTKKLASSIMSSMASLSNSVNSTISSYANYVGSINTRLQGSRGNLVNIFDDIENRLKGVSYSPLLNTEKLYSNLSSLVKEGIAYNVEQRAFLQTIKDDIAETFDTNNSSLKRIIRLQQMDSTAARLGMEAYLTSYLNDLTKNTEYLQSTFDSVADSLLEASSLLSHKESTEFEYVVQKWLGTMTGLGLSESAATSIAQALGKLGSGDVSVVGTDIGKLLMMASSKSGVDIGSVLTSGFADTNKLNELLYSMMSYLAEIGSSASNVTKSQMAQTFGVSVSDLVAVGNLFNKDNESRQILENLRNNMLSYGDMLSELSGQMNQMNQRMGMAKMLENLFANFKYSQGLNIATNPALYGLWKVTDLIQSVTGGINIPTVSVLGNSVDLNTTVENLMKTGLIGVSTLTGIGDIISGIGTAFGSNASKMLNTLGILNTQGVQRGLGLGGGNSIRSSNITTSLSTMTGNYRASDYSQSVLASAKDEANTEVELRKSEESSTDKLLKIQNNYTEEIISIIKNIEDRVSGTLRVINEDSSMSGVN